MIRTICTAMAALAVMAAPVSADHEPAGDPGASALPPAPPQPSPGPEISGNASEGQTLTASYGGWGPGVSTEGEWLRCDAAGGSCVRTHKVGATYGLAAADAGKRMRFRVKGTAVWGGWREADSQPTDVVEGPPRAAFTFSPSSPQTGQRVDFTSTSFDPDGDPLAYAWDLNGDGGFDDGSGATAARSFGNPGDYMVGHRVSAGGQSAIAFDTVTVATPPPRPGAPPKASPPGSSTRSFQSFGPATPAGRASLLSPFPVVIIAGRVFGNGSRVSRLIVRGPVGARVFVLCRGRDCPFRRKVRVIRSGAVSFGRFPNLLRPNTLIELAVTKPGSIGRHTRFRIRQKRAPGRRDRCLLAGYPRPILCPGP
jgi:hypothetical protein